MPPYQNENPSPIDPDKDIWLLQALLDTIIDPAFFKDIDGIYRACNQSFAQRIIGLPINKVLGAGLHDFPDRIPPDLAKTYQEHDRAMLASGENEEYEAEVLCSDQNRHTFFFRKTILRDSTGKPRGIIGVMQDISQRRNAEKARDQAEEAAANIFRYMINGFGLTELIYDAEGHVEDYITTKVNQAFESLTGIPEKGFINKRACEVLPDLPPEWLQALEQVDKTGEPHKLELYFPPLDKTLELSLFRTQPGKVGVIFTDMTDKHHMQENLRRINHCLIHLTADYDKNMQSITTLAAELLHADIALYNRLENGALATVTRWPQSASCEKIAKGMLCRYMLLREETEQESIEEQAAPPQCHPAQKDGVPFHVESYMGRTVRMHNRAVGVLCVLFENDHETTVDELELLETLALALGTEEEKKEAEKVSARLHTAVEHSAEAIVLTDPDGIIQYVNPAFEDITGYSRNEALGMNPNTLKSGQHDDLFYAELWQTIKSGKTWKGVFINKHKDGSFFHEEATISPICSSRGDHIGYVAVKHNITEQIRMEEQLRQAQKMEAVGQLAGGVAHDFNNLLQVIHGYTQLALMDIPPEEITHANLQQIQKAAGRATHLVEQLLTFSRQQMLNAQPVQINYVLKELLDMLKRLIGEHIDLQFQPAQDLPTINADTTQLEHILINLCVNARDAMPKGGTLRISTAVETLTPEKNTIDQSEAQGDYVCVQVEDTGCGIPENKISSIFEPFYTTKDVGKGTGLGLSSVYGIMKQHEGVLDVKSETDKGTTFYLYFPVHKDTRQEKREETPTQPEGGHEVILLAEDDPLVQKIARRLLEKGGYKVLTANDGKEALSLFYKNQNQIDLALLDMVMPKVSGKAVYEELRQYDLPIIFSTGYSMETIDQSMLPDKDLPLIRKPYQMDELLQLIRNTIDNHLKRSGN